VVDRWSITAFAVCAVASRWRAGDPRRRPPTTGRGSVRAPRAPGSRRWPELEARRRHARRHRVVVPGPRRRL